MQVQTSAHNVTYTPSKILHLSYFHTPSSCWELLNSVMVQWTKIASTDDARNNVCEVDQLSEVEVEIQ